MRTGFASDNPTVDARERANLDRWITGNYGENQFRKTHMETITFPDHTRGIDINRPVTDHMANLIQAAGASFVMRYLSRTQTIGPLDCTEHEAQTIRNYGLALGFVQHVRSLKLWSPLPRDGHEYGSAARSQLLKLGVPRGTTVALDLEMVKAPHEIVAGYVNDWNEQVSVAGYEPGIYLGFRDALNSEEAYHALSSVRYWVAYNLDLDRYPAHRGVCIRQQSAAHFIIPGLTLYDVNVTQTDRFGGRWTFWNGEDIG